MMENGTANHDIKSRIEFLENSIKVLPERDFTLIEYYAYDEIPIAKIMSKLFISRRTVYDRINRIGKQIELIYQYENKSSHKIAQK